MMRGIWGRVCGLLLWTLAGLMFSSEANAVSQTRSPTSCTSSTTSSGTVAWTNPGNVLASDNAYATASVDGTTTRYLQCTGFNFSIPSNASIMGITVRVERKSNDTANGGSNDSVVRLIKAGTVGATDRSTTTAFTTSDVAEDHGGIVDKWGDIWTPSDIMASNFGVAYAATKASASGAAHTVSVDQIQITVDYMPCSAPSNIPSGVSVTCYCDNFTTTLGTSPIFNSAWALSNSDNISNPSISANGLLRLTEATANNAKAATVPGLFPAMGNYISVEFHQYAYGASTNPGADGIAVTLSDSAQSVNPGAFGGSLGYAQKTPPAVTANVPGFRGGWLGVAFDEYGNYANPSEGRVGGTGAASEAIGLRGPGKDVEGYRWIGGTGSNSGGLSIDNRTSTVPAPGYLYQVIVDARDATSGTVNVAVNRDSTTRDGTSYSALIAPLNAYTEASYAKSQNWISQIVPDYWKISFTASTGGANNIHEIGALRVCAQTAYPPTGSTASGFSAIDEAYPIAANSIPSYADFLGGDIYMKLQGAAFKLWIGALTTSSISTAYSVSSDKYVQVKLVNNNDIACGAIGSARTCTASCTGKTAVTGGTQVMTYTSSDKGGKLSSNFTINTAYKDLVAIMRECTDSTCAAFTATPAACSADSFSVRPTGISSLTSTANGASTSSILKAGFDTFPFTATIVGIAGNSSGYTGNLKINKNGISMTTPASAAAVPSTSPPTFDAATSNTPNATVTSNFSFSEVGSFTLLGATDATSPRGVYEGVLTSLECASGTVQDCNDKRKLTWTGVDSLSSKGDCLADNFSNTISTSSDPALKGKYGCNFGLNATTSSSTPFGRFIPYRFDVSGASIVNRSDFGSGAGCSPASTFTYMGEPFRIAFTLSALNGNGDVTKNYIGTNAKFAPAAANWTQYNVANANTMGLWMVANNFPYNGGTCTTMFSNTSPYATTFACTAGSKSAINRTSGARVALSGAPTGGTWTDGVTSYTTDVKLEKADSVDGPYDNLSIGIYPRDSDGVVPVTGTNLDTDNNSTLDRVSLGTTSMRFGQVRIDNAYGSELLNLLANASAQYWNGSAFVTNPLDSCTALNGSTLSLSNKTGGLSTATISLLSGATVSTGSGKLLVSKPTISGSPPTSKGSVDLTSGISYLPGTGRLVFGVFKNGQVIYLREIH